MDAKQQAIQVLFFPSLKRRVNYSSKPDGGGFFAYRHFRKHFQHEIAEDCVCRCVYCDSHENEMGGRELMEVDHFRPYTRKGFENLENDPSNFHHSCGRCNRLKSAKWPSTHPKKSHDGVVGFVDPFAEDRREYFSVESDGELKPLRPPGQYLTRLLALNRPHLKLLRQRRICLTELRAYVANNSPQWEKAAQGGGGMTEQEAFAALIECKRLFELCTMG